MKFNHLLFAITFAALAGCSATPPTPVSKLPTDVESIREWETEGRVGVRTENDAVSGNFLWHKTPNEFDLNIVGPFGQGATHLQGNDQSAKLTVEDRTTTGRNAEVLLYQELGWRFPIRQVNYWIRGLAHPTTSANITYVEDSNQVATIEQDGWTVHYRDYTQIEHLNLPQRLQVERPPYRINLIITQWSVK